MRGACAAELEANHGNDSRSRDAGLILALVGLRLLVRVMRSKD
jgi:hypothetical protein